MKKYLMALMLCTVSLSMLNTANVSQVQAETEQEEPAKQKDNSCLMGFYYKEKEFKNLVLMAEKTENTLDYKESEVEDLLSTEEQTFQSMRWKGRIKAKEASKSTFKITDDSNTQIKIDGKIVSNNGKDKQVVTLEKDHFYELIIEYTPEKPMSINELEKKKMMLFKLTDEKTEPVDNKELFQSAVQRSENANYAANYEEENSDWDGDEIENEWEIHGYTAISNKIVAWKDEYSPKYTKYVSDPLKARTAGDPYTDKEKVLDHTDLSRKKEARNPMIAIRPVINVTLDSLIVTSNDTSSKSHSFQLSNSVSHTTSLGGSASVGAGLTPEGALGFSARVSGSYERGESNTVEVRNNDGKTTEISDNERALLKAGMRYNNIGTGTIYNLKPTISLGLDSSTITTIRVQENNQALSLTPEKSFPPIGDPGTVMWTGDDFNNKNISLNTKQYKALLNNNSPLKLEMNQMNGNYISKDKSNEITMEEAKWSYYIPQIDKSTAAIIIDNASNNENYNTGGVSQKHIAAKDYDDPEDLTPSISLYEALKLAYPDEIEDKNGLLFYQGVPLYEEAVISYLDENTKNLIERQIKADSGPFQDVHTLFDAKLEPEMNITLKTSVIYVGGEEDKNVDTPEMISGVEPFVHQGLSVASPGNTGSKAVVVGRRENFKFLDKDVKKLHKDTAYTFSFYVANMDGGKLDFLNSYVQLETSSGYIEGTHRNISITEQESNTRKHGYKRYDIDFFNEEGKEVTGINFSSEYDILVDDIAIVERASSDKELELMLARKKQKEAAEKEALHQEMANRLESIFAAPIIQESNSHQGRWDSMIFENVKNQLGNIKIKSIRVKGQTTERNFDVTLPLYNFESNGNLKVNLLDYNKGHGFLVEKNYQINLFAILDNGEEYGIYSFGLKTVE